MKTKAYCRILAILIGGTGFASPAMAAQADLDMLQQECGPQLNLSAAGCQCIADTAAAQLNDVQQAFVAA